MGLVQNYLCRFGFDSEDDSVSISPWVVFVEIFSGQAIDVI